MIDDKADKLNNDRLPGQPESSTEYGGLEAELQKNLGQAVKNEMDEMTEEEMVEIYENSNTLKGMVAKRKKELMDGKEEEKKKRFFLLVKFGSVAGLLGILVIFASIAWFTMNKEIGSGGMSVSTVGDTFTISPLGDPAHVGIYDDEGKSGTYVRDKLLDEAGKESDIIIWTITDDVATTVTESGTTTTTVTKGKNIGNGPAQGFEGGISPGSRGEIQFIITPSQQVTATFTFRVFAYTGGYDEHGDEDKTTITLIESGSGTNPEALIAEKLMNGHLLLFTDIDDTTGRYYGLLDSDDEFKRVMTKLYSTQETVSIYWIWPETLAELLLDDTDSTQARNMRGKKNICTSAGRTEVINFFKSNPEWFLLDPVDTNHDWSDTFSDQTNNADVISTINTEYSLYSSYYNEADQCIGTHVSYILLDMIASDD